MKWVWNKTLNVHRYLIKFWYNKVRRDLKKNVLAQNNDNTFTNELKLLEYLPQFLPYCMKTILEEHV